MMTQFLLPFPELTVGSDVLLASEITKLYASLVDRNAGAKKSVRTYRMKQLMFDDSERRLSDWLSSICRDPQEREHLEAAIGEETVRDLESVQVGGWEHVVNDPELQTALWHRVGDRIAMVQFLVDLSLFKPWAVGELKFDRNQVDQALGKSVGNLGMRPRENETLPDIREQIELRNRLLCGAPLPNARRLHRGAALAVDFIRRPGGKATVAGFGLAAGALTGGLAAPAIGAALAPAGLSGAAAAGAGLATLGGGSLAAGGAGMLGGTMLIQTAGAVVGAGVLAGAAEGGSRGSAQYLREVRPQDFATELSQLLALVDLAIAPAGNVDLILGIQEAITAALADHETAQHALGSAATSDKYGIGLKVKLLRRTASELQARTTPTDSKHG